MQEGRRESGLFIGTIVLKIGDDFLEPIKFSRNLPKPIKKIKNQIPYIFKIPVFIKQELLDLEN